MDPDPTTLDDVADISLYEHRDTGQKLGFYGESHSMRLDKGKNTYDYFKELLTNNPNPILYTEDTPKKVYGTYHGGYHGTDDLQEFGRNQASQQLRNLQTDAKVGNRVIPFNNRSTNATYPEDLKYTAHAKWAKSDDPPTEREKQFVLEHASSNPLSTRRSY